MRDDRVDEPIAAPVCDIGFGESEVQQALGVVGQAEVGLGVPARDRASGLGVGFDDDGYLWGDKRVAPEPVAREARVLRRDEVRVGAERTLFGEVEHLWPQRGEHELVARYRLRRGSQAVTERAHVRQWPGVVAGRLRMADADAEQEAPRERRAQLRVRRRDVG